MHIILGATGHVGSATAYALLEKGEAVTVVSRDAKKAAKWGRRGARVAVADVNETSELRAIFRGGRRLFLLNPPADPSSDTDAVERRSLTSIIAALKGSALERIVALSAYGAQPGAHLFDLGVLYELEQALAAQPIPTAVIRAAYYFSNWDASLESAQTEGVVHTFFPTRFQMPMVSPDDIGWLAAELMAGPPENSGLHHVEGPERYAPEDVAKAFSTALHHPVRAVETPPPKWMDALQKMGFSEAAAKSFSNMTAATLRESFEPTNPRRGNTTLQQHVSALVRAPTSSPS